AATHTKVGATRHDPCRRCPKDTLHAPNGMCALVTFYGGRDPFSRQRVRNKICLATATCEPLATLINHVNIEVDYVHKADRSISASVRVPASAMVISSSVRNICSTWATPAAPAAARACT